MTRNIFDKTEEIRIYLKEFKQIIPKDFSSFMQIEKKAACERYIEKITEACCDIGYLILKDNKIDLSEFDGRVFDKLYEINKLPLEIAEKMIRIKGMRNLIIHQYGNIDYKVIFSNLINFITDINIFLKEVQK